MPRLMGTRKKSRASIISDKRIRNNDRLTGNLTPSIIPSADEIPEKYQVYLVAIGLEYILAHEYVHIWCFDSVTKLVLIAELCIGLTHLLG